MSRLHVCNTFFEQELATVVKHSLKNWLTSSSFVSQLQYLPILYADKDDRILVTKLYPELDERLCLIDAPPYLPIETWGSSNSVAQYAAEYGLVYLHPSLEIVRQIQSKSFSFQKSPLPGSALLFTQKEVQDWIQQIKGPKVLKKMLGLSGRGHFLVDRSPKLGEFLQREFSENRPVLGEPWVKRILDFSSQWEIGDTIELKGVTRFEVDDQGGYLGTLAGKREEIFPDWNSQIDFHLERAREVLRDVQELGFFGPIGIDAFIYEGEKLQPIVEINARRTMSRVALDIQKQRSPEHVLRMTFVANNSRGLLPGSCKSNVFLETF